MCSVTCICMTCANRGDESPLQFGALLVVGCAWWAQPELKASIMIGADQNINGDDRTRLVCGCRA